MSSGVNIKVISRRQSDAGVSSSLPSPRSTMSVSKAEPKEQYSGLPNPTMQYQHSAKRRPTYSSFSGSSGAAELLRGAALKNNLLHQKTSMYSHRSSAAAGRADGTCSAYSSPQIPKREVPRSKDTSDICSDTITQKALRDLQLRRNTNKNWTFGKYRQRSVDNAQEGNTLRHRPPNPQVGYGRGRLLYSKNANGNEIPGVSSAGIENFQKEVRNISNYELEASDRELFNKSKSSHQTFNLPRRGSEPGKVNMAAVAPFRFRWGQCFTF